MPEVYLALSRPPRIINSAIYSIPLSLGYSIRCFPAPSNTWKKGGTSEGVSVFRRLLVGTFRRNRIASVVQDPLSELFGDASYQWQSELFSQSPHARGGGPGQSPSHCLGTPVHWASGWGQETGLGAQRRQALAAKGVIILGDDLFSKEPFCQDLLTQGFHFILVCKPDSHKTLYEWVASLEKTGSLQSFSRQTWNGRFHERATYRYLNQLPLNGSETALAVNWVELTVTRPDTGEILYKNAFYRFSPHPEHCPPDCSSRTSSMEGGKREP
jgi:hypothetical protein